MQFEALPKERFTVENVDGVDRIVIRAGRNWFILIFLSIWLIGWSAGGVAAITNAITGGDEGRTFIFFWLIFWAFGMAFAGSIVGWQLSGRETLAVRQGALERGWSLLGIGRTKHYEVAKIRGLSAGSTPFPYNTFRFSQPPFLPMIGGGAVKWNYGAATLYAASGLSEAEGEMIVAHLARYLPAVVLEN